jgi:cysteine-rich repeat protein
MSSKTVADLAATRVAWMMMGVRVVLATLCVVATAACEIQIGARFADGDDVISATCGDFIVDPDEVCDDGNNADGDGCSANCKSDETCGNGLVDTAVGETCDDGNLLGGDGCSADCTSDETCGNGVLDTAKGETCDDGNLVAGDGCSANCQSNEACGNGIVDPGTTPAEQCDAGPNGSATCNINCTNASCGDGIVNPLRNEQCEDGNNNNNDACVGCRFARCGDGFVRTGVEQCDDGNNNNGDGCNANCQIEPVVFVVGINELQNQTTSCDSVGGINRYDGCNGAPFGFSWVDNSTFQPGTIEITFNRGIDCYSNYFAANQPVQYAVNANLNNQNFVDVTITSDASSCLCDPGQQLHTVTISGAGYVRGGTNTFLFNGTFEPSGMFGGICAGFSPSASLGGGYARIVVYP